ncbi:MAG: N-methyl-D-aspartate receptor NMDAR2C subunit [Burkholderiales bacterium]|nr:N-methyl-D-aspartate receptor NMDAR2C subunit [Burkholderiales bacterium]
MSSLWSWVETWRELGAMAADEGIFNRLCGCWTEKHRKYHTLQHLRECMSHLDAAYEEANQPAEIRLALWFHDAYYDPRRKDNEARSAQWASESILQAGLAPEVAQRVHTMVMATCTHSPAADRDLQLLLDIDLAILGAEAPRFDESDLQVRAEYAHVPDAEFREGRTRVLTGFLERPRLYGTPFFHDALEERARDNLRRSLARLRAASAT